MPAASDRSVAAIVDAAGRDEAPLVFFAVVPDDLMAGVVPLRHGAIIADDDEDPPPLVNHDRWSF